MRRLLPEPAVGSPANIFESKGKSELKKNTALYVLVLLFFGTAGWASNAKRNQSRVGLSEGGSSSRERVAYSRLPLSFEANEGQTNLRAKYLARGQNFTLFLTSGDAVLQLGSPWVAAPGAQSPFSGFRPRLSSFSPTTGTSDLIRLKLLGARQGVKIMGADKLAGYSNYFLGNDPRHWYTHIPNYARVRYEQVYPGIDLVYHGHQGQLENDFVLSAGADPNRVRLGFEGIESMHLDPSGDLVLKVRGGEIYLRRPRAYQGERGERHEVKARYVLQAGMRVSFGLGPYDRRQQLVIDPVLTYSSYLGGSGGDAGSGIVLDSSGDAYVTGTTGSLNFPTTSSGQTTTGGGKDAFVTKFNPAGTALIYSVYLGGSADDSATGIALDSSGNAYIVGYTYSTNFPTTSGAFQTANDGNADAFLAKLDPSGSSLVYSTYLGGSDTDYGYGVAVDASGDVFVTGSTLSMDFPTMSPLQVGNDGYSDAFVSEFNPLGTGLLYSTYLGGTGGDVGYAIALDGAGNPYVAGYTTSTDFPTQNALQSSLAGGADAFIAEINPETSSLVFSTYLGGSGADVAYALALDAAGSIYVAGSSSSDDFPVTAGAFQTANHGQGDAFIAKLAPGVTQLVYSSLLGGSGSDQAKAIALDSSGDAFLTGFTQSSNFPLADALQRVLGISGASSCGVTFCSDAFVSKFGPSGDLVYSTFLGGNGADAGQAIAVDSTAAAYVTGSTASANFPVIGGAPQSTYAGATPSSNAFVAKISPQDDPAVALSPQKINFGNQALNTASTAQTVTLVDAGSAPLEIAGITASGDFSQTNNCGTLVSAGSGTCAIQVIFTPSQLGPVTNQITIADNAQGSPQTITVSGTGVTTSGGSLTLSPSSLSFPAETVGTTSPTQTVQVVNTGSTPVTLTSVAVTGDFAEANNCGTLPNVLNVGAACSVSVSFTPKASGALTGALTIQDNAGNSPQTVALAGTGNAVFSLSANMRSTVLAIGSKSTQFIITASAPSSFLSNLTLSCTGQTACTFNPSTITAGESSTLTVSGLTSSSTSPVNITVQGTTGTQTVTLPLTIFLADYSLSVTPSVTSITAGQSATYTLTVTPTNGFNQVVLLSCSNLPQDTTCTYSPPGLTLDGTSASTATLSVKTTAESSASLLPRPRGTPPPGSPLQFKWWVYLVALGLVLVPGGILWSRRAAGRTPLRLRAAFTVLATVGVLVAFVAACNNYSYGPNISSAVSGTPANTYTITLVGTLGSDNSIKRTTTINLAVAP